MGVELSWQELTPFLAQGGVTSVLAFIAYKLHRDAVDAHDKRANDARERAEAAEARADLREQQINVLIGRRNGSGRPGR